MDESSEETENVSREGINMAEKGHASNCALVTPLLLQLESKEQGHNQTDGHGLFGSLERQSGPNERELAALHSMLALPNSSPPPQAKESSDRLDLPDLRIVTELRGPSKANSPVLEQHEVGLKLNNNVIQESARFPPTSASLRKDNGCVKSLLALQRHHSPHQDTNRGDTSPYPQDGNCSPPRHVSRRGGFHRGRYVSQPDISMPGGGYPSTHFHHQESYLHSLPRGHHEFHQYEHGYEYDYAPYDGYGYRPAYYKTTGSYRQRPPYSAFRKYEPKQTSASNSSNNTEAKKSKDQDKTLVGAGAGEAKEDSPVNDARLISPSITPAADMNTSYSTHHQGKEISCGGEASSEGDNKSGTRKKKRSSTEPSAEANPQYKQSQSSPSFRRHSYQGPPPFMHPSPHGQHEHHHLYFRPYIGMPPYHNRFSDLHRQYPHSHPFPHPHHHHHHERRSFHEPPSVNSQFGESPDGHGYAAGESLDGHGDAGFGELPSIPVSLIDKGALNASAHQQTDHQARISQKDKHLELCYPLEGPVPSKFWG
jgi:hypothetical protein